MRSALAYARIGHCHRCVCVTHDGHEDRGVAALRDAAGPEAGGVVGTMTESDALRAGSNAGSTRTCRRCERSSSPRRATNYRFSSLFVGL
jgi:hypothetical protein